MDTGHGHDGSRCTVMNIQNICVSRVFCLFDSAFTESPLIFHCVRLGFLNEQAKLAQARVEQSFQSQHNKHFMNLDECARNVLANNECTTDNTLPVTLEAIANIEEHPKPDEVNDIDLKVLYQFLANITAGYPINDLENGPTKDFLKQCFSVRANCGGSYLRILFSL